MTGVVRADIKVIKISNTLYDFFWNGGWDYCCRVKKIHIQGKPQVLLRSIIFGKHGATPPEIQEFIHRFFKIGERS